jgi:succinate dehydrogenase / fumarate reductase, flavoprotein subunit
MTFNSTKRKFDVIIIGAGGAGLMAALSSIKNGVKNVAVISKVFPTSSHTVAAKGGINAALGNVGFDDWQWHAYDTIKGSDFLADHDAVEYMCQAAPQAIINLEKMGVVFSRAENGKIYQRPYGGQSTNYGKGSVAHRACSAKDNTGHTILHSLHQQCLKNGVKFFSEFFVTDLLMEDNICHGAIAIDLNEGQINHFEAKITILATGGHSQIYQNTTSSAICTGDGGAMILRSGLQMQDMEFVQFHPTGLYGSGFLITEGIRGEGGYLINSLGERFMQNYAPKYLDLASRDVVARAMATEIHEGRGCGVNQDHLYLVVNHLGGKIINQKFPGVADLVKSFAKIDITQSPIPVVPVAHYMMGGIPTNLNCQVTYFNGEEEKIVAGLMAIGEAACVSVHGANRLGCNSLLDIIVFGNLAGTEAAKMIDANSSQINPQILQEKIQKIRDILNKNGEENTYKIKSELQKTIWQFAGVFRNESLLKVGLNKLLELQKRFEKISIKNKTLLWNNELTEYLETENLLSQGIATISSALSRKESRGAHYREDFPLRDDENWLCHSLFAFKGQNNFDFKTKSVRNKAIGVDQMIITPEERKY